MDDINRSITEYVKSGKYYEDARSWYLNTFINPISHRSYLFALTIFYFLVIAIAGYYYSNTNPAEPQATYLVFEEDIAKTYSSIHPPSNDDKVAPQTRITEYVLKRYIQTRESYDIKHIKSQLDYIKNTTVEDNYQQYENSMSINNPNGPMMIYQDQFKKIINVKKVDLLKKKNNDGTAQAIAYFQSILRNLATNEETIEYFVATINYKIDNIEDLMKNDATKLDFLVLRYNSNKVDKK